jgi:hypothetical protein
VGDGSKNPAEVRPPVANTPPAPPTPAPPRPNPGTGPKNNGAAPPPAAQPRVPGAAPTKPRVTVGNGGGLIVVVHGPDNQPVAGAVVEASAARGALAPRPTNKSGEAALDRAEGKITGVVHHPRFSQSVQFSADPGQARVDVTFAAGSAGGVLTGVIRDNRGGAPAVARLTVIDPAGNETDLESTTFAAYDPASGRYRCELAAGSYTVKASADGYVPSDLSYPTITAGQDTTCPDLILEHACTIGGKVDLPPDLQALRDPVVLTFDVECIRGDPQNPNTTTKHLPLQLDQNGGFQITDLQAGMYRVRAGDGQRIGAWAAVKLDEGSSATIGLSLFGLATATPLRGLVRDSRGALVAGALVRTKLVTATTDASGTFELRGLDPGKQELAIEKPGYVRYTQTVDIPLAGNPPLPDQLFVIYARGSASGKVTRKGSPAPGVQVLVIQKADNGGVKPYGPATTDGTGTWSISDLDAGQYYVKVGANTDIYDPTNAPTFAVTPGDLVQVGSIEAP